MTDRTRFRSGARTGRGAAYDADAQAYIEATGELFPEALNTLVLGIKAAGLWDDHIGSIKKAIGVPSLAASMIDLRNTAFNGTAVNTPGHSATEGWTFVAASSQYIDGGWNAAAANSKATQNSVHVGLRMRAGSAAYFAAGSLSGGVGLDFQGLADGYQEFRINSSTAGGGSYPASPYNPVAPRAYILTRTNGTTVAFYGDGTLKELFTINSNGAGAQNFYLGCRNNAGTADSFTSGRYSVLHFGAALDGTQVANLNTLLDAYATAAGET